MINKLYYEIKNKLLSNNTKYLFGFFVKGLAFLTALFIRIFTVSEYGNMSLLLNIITFFSLFISFNFYQASIRLEVENKFKNIFSIYIFYISQFLILNIIILLFSLIYDNLFGFSFIFLHLLSIVSLFQVFFLHRQEFHRFYGKATTYVKRLVSLNVLIYLLTIIIYLVFD